MADKTTQLAEIEYLLKKLENADSLPQKLREEIDIMVKRTRRMARQGNMSEEYELVAKYIDWCMRTPWDKYTKDNLDLSNVRSRLDEGHYGLNDVKEAITEYIAVLRKKDMMGEKDYRAPILAFVGPQGTGKTTMAKAIAKSLGRPFVRVSLGAVSTSSEIRGMPKGTIEAEPGQIIKALAKAEVLTPVILLDELDKVSGESGKLKDLMAILLEVLDPQQNTAFRDHYIDYSIDLSKVFFICTANSLKPITKALLDRLEVVEFRDYTKDEKVAIGRDYLLKNVLKYAGLMPQELTFSDDVWPVIVESCKDREGVRTLERTLERLARKVTKQIVTGQTEKVHITRENVESYIDNDSQNTRAKNFNVQKMNLDGLTNGNNINQGKNQINNQSANMPKVQLSAQNRGNTTRNVLKSSTNQEVTDKQALQEKPKDLNQNKQVKQGEATVSQSKGNGGENIQSQQKPNNVRSKKNNLSDLKTSPPLNPDLKTSPLLNQSKTQSVGPEQTVNDFNKGVQDKKTQKKQLPDLPKNKATNLSKKTNSQDINKTSENLQKVNNMQGKEESKKSPLVSQKAIPDQQAGNANKNRVSNVGVNTNQTNQLDQSQTELNNQDTNESHNQQ